jgi:superfamily II RNA helicase
MTIHASVVHENGATTQHEQSNNATSAKTRKDTTRPPPVDTVVCVETKPLESANETTNDGTSTFLQEQDVAVFYSDESLSQSKSPLLPPQDLKFDNGGLSDGDLMKLLDSPKVCYKTETTTTTSASMPAAASSLPFQSPSESTTSVDTENLEIPHACHTPRETASSRFFGAEQPGFNNKDKGTTNPTSVLPQTNKTTPTQDVIDLMDENDTLETNLQARRETTASTAQHEHPHHHDNKETSMNCAAEVDPSVYQPLAYQYKPDPVVHYLSIHNRPKNARTTIAVQDLFGPPLSGIWKFSSFNPLQSQVANTLAHSDDSIVVSAPTGAGKTCLFEMAMARFFSSTCANKVVYMAPSKALVEERFSDWQERFAILGHHIQCSMITGDAEPGEAYRDVAAANIILTTPEKWDSLTRKWTENVYLFGSVKLLLLDEVHLLGDGTRGSCLESIVCRMKTIQRAAVAASETYDAHASSSR